MLVKSRASNDGDASTEYVRTLRQALAGIASNNATIQGLLTRLYGRRACTTAIQQSREAGAIGYVLKPFIPSLSRAALEHC